MSVVSLVADATTALGSDVVALAFDAEPPDQAAAAMQIALAAAADPSDLVRILVDAFGRAGLRRVLATLAVPIASGVDAETLATA